jgi:hypothetical protein
MELVLIAVTSVSLVIAVVMSVVAWTLLKNERQRSAARVEALEALAFTDDLSETMHVKTVERPAAREAAVTPAPAEAAPAAMAPAAVETKPAAGIDSQAEDWDLALSGRPSRDFHPVAKASPRDTTRDDMFEHAPAQGVAGRRWLAVAAVVLVVGAGVAVAAALRSPEIVAAVAASHEADGSPLALLSLRHTTEADGTFTVTGFVQNPLVGRQLEGLEAVVYLYDDSGRYFATGRGPLEVPTIAPGDESPFVVKVAVTTPISRYRVGFRSQNGRVVAHVDRRGHLPTGTTGDVLGEPELARPAGGMRPIEGAAR